MTKNNTRITACVIVRVCFEMIYKIEKKWVLLDQVSEIEMNEQNEIYNMLNQLEIWFDKQNLDWEEIISKVYRTEFEEKFRVLEQNSRTVHFS